MNPEFCTTCGASFPPREGEGTCINWEFCRDIQQQDDEQTELFGDPNIIEVSPPL